MQSSVQRRKALQILGLLVPPFGAGCTMFQKSIPLTLHIFNTTPDPQFISIRILDDSGNQKFATGVVELSPAQNESTKRVMEFGFDSITAEQTYTIERRLGETHKSKSITVDCGDYDGEQVGVRITDGAEIDITESSCS